MENPKPEFPLPTFAITVTFEVKPEHIKAFERRMLQQASDSLENEPGCLQFDVLSNETQPNIFFLYETYVDAAAFDAHLQTRHFLEFNAAVADWVISKCVQRLNLLAGSGQTKK